MTTTYSQKDVVRFWSNIDIGSHNECWGWELSTSSGGYGKVKIKRKVLVSHRVAFELMNGEIGKGMHILHSCDNRLCCNPAHLRQGTHTDNMADMKKRKRCFRFKPHGRKLTKEKADEIRALSIAGRPKRAIARMYNISPVHVRAVINMEYWK